ncbi:MAG: FkbM family methyltransferase [Candidatus Gracilibacteria bacterium]|nr:FkbM family methyltransferase [Candidatus Gracilibacteria bacterium]
MYYIKVRNKIEKILPKYIFNILINSWRMIIRIKRKNQEKKLKNFIKDIYKKVKIKNISFQLLISHKNGTVDNEIFINGIYEKEIFYIMYKNIKKDYICVDIGANIGMYTNFLPKLVGKNGKVIGFEPIQAIYNQNLSSINKNKYENVYLYNKACSDVNGETIININDLNMGGSSIERKNSSNITEKISTIIGDEILLKEEKINFIKIDTEGHEWKVIKGIEKTINKFSPKMIIEFSPYLFSDKNDGKKILDFFLCRYNYVYIVEKGEKLNLKKENDIYKYYELENETQVNLFFY